MSVTIRAPDPPEDPSVRGSGRPTGDDFHPLRQALVQPGDLRSELRVIRGKQEAQGDDLGPHLLRRARDVAGGEVGTERDDAPLLRLSGRGRREGPRFVPLPDGVPLFVGDCQVSLFHF